MLNTAPWLAMLLIALASVSPPARTADAVTTLAVDGRSNANPTIAARGAFVAVTWSAATTNAMDIFVATSRDGGRTFSAPVQVNAVAGEARVSGEQPPHVALVPRAGIEPGIVIVWTAKSGANWRLLSARSNDGGRTFGAAAPVPGSDAVGSRGWESVSVDASGRVRVLWLDHRDLVAADSGRPHVMASMGSPAAEAKPAPKADPVARAQLSQLHVAALDGAGSTAITRGVCYCCKTALVTSGANVFAAWRHVYPGSLRDIAFTVSRDGGRTFAAPLRVSEDRWQIDGCPDDGPALALDRAQRAHVVWPTLQEGAVPAAMGVYYAVSRDGRAFSPRVRVPSRGPASHPQIVIGGSGEPLVAWDEVVDGARRIAMARVRTDARGQVTFVNVQPPDGMPGQSYPALASTASGTVAAWVRQSAKGSVIAVAALH